MGNLRRLSLWLSWRLVGLRLGDLLTVPLIIMQSGALKSVQIIPAGNDVRVQFGLRILHSHHLDFLRDQVEFAERIPTFLRPVQTWLSERKPAARHDISVFETIFHEVTSSFSFIIWSYCRLACFIHHSCFLVR